jgi:hypothetical protein
VENIIQLAIAAYYYFIINLLCLFLTQIFKLSINREINEVAKVINLHGVYFVFKKTAQDNT